MKERDWLDCVEKRCESLRAGKSAGMPHAAIHDLPRAIAAVRAADALLDALAAYRTARGS